jgi:hypothetical protein
MNTLNQAKEAAKILSAQMGIELTSSKDFHGDNAFTDIPWPTLVADWGVIDLLPAEKDSELLIQGFSNETCSVHELIVDVSNEATAMVQLIAGLFNFALVVRNDK